VRDVREVSNDAHRTAPSGDGPGQGLTAAGRRSRNFPDYREWDARHTVARRIVMYIRFVCPGAHPHRDAELGIYHAIDLIDHDAQPRWLADDYLRAFESLRGIPVPGCVSLGAGTADGRRGLCWLRGDRDDLVAGFRHLAWVMGEMGVPVAEIAVRDPGHIIYRDEAQIVAVPRRGLPRAFPRRALR
jgi:hypothetical protein